MDLWLGTAGHAGQGKRVAWKRGRLQRVTHCRHCQIRSFRGGDQWIIIMHAKYVHRPGEEVEDFLLLQKSKERSKFHLSYIFLYVVERRVGC